jgi:hypothetical protein
VVVNSAGILSFEDPPSFSDLVGASTFLELTDTPASYTGQAGKVVVVNSAEDGLIFSDIIIPSFTTSGHTGNEIVVTDWTISGTDIILKRAGVDMVDGLVKSWGLLSDIVIQGSTCSCPSDQVGASTFLELTDTPSTYGTPGQYVTINSAGDGLIFTDLPSDSDIIYGVIDDGGLAKLNNSFCIDFNNMDSLLTPTLSWQFIGYNPDLSTKPVRKTTLEEINNAMEFIKLTDTPVAYFSDDAGKHVVVNSTADGLIFVDLPSDQIGPSTFLELTDTPATYSGEAGKYVIVNSTEDALIFVDLPSDQIGPTSWIDLNDTDSALGTPGQRVVVDPTGQFLTFEDIPSITPFPSGGLTSDTDVLISWTVNGSGNIVTTTQLHTYTDGLLTAKAAPVTTIISTEECSCPSDQVGASTFLELTDTPGAYGTAGQYVIINSTADGLIFTDLPTDSDLLYSTTVDLGLIKDSANNFGIDFDNMTATSTLNLMDWVITNQGGPEVQRTGLAEVNAIFRFILQEDTPSTYVGQAGKYIRVNSTPNGLEFVDPPTENSVVVNDGLYKDNSNDFGMDFDNTENTAPVLTDEIFHGTGTTVNANTLSDINAIMEFIRLTDTPAAYAGEANKLVAVNGGATALEFIDASTAVGGLIPIISGFTGNKDVVTDWYVSGTTVVLERANISVLDGLVKNIVDISALMISAEECSCPSDQVGASTFLELTDTPSTYGNAGQYVTINSAGDGLIFTDLPSDQVGASTWVQLNDTVSAIGTPGQHVVVNSAGILSFADLASDLIGASTFLELTDTPSVYGTQGQYVVINSTADGLVFVDLPSDQVGASTWVQLNDTVSTIGTPGQHVVVNSAGILSFADLASDLVGASTFLELTDTPSVYTGEGGKYVIVNSAENALIFVDLPSDQIGPTSWIDLNDTDSALGTPGQIVVVDSTGTFLTFADLASDLVGASTFLELTDTPATYSGQAGKQVIVNSAEDGLIFVDIASDLIGASTFLELTDTPSVYGTQGQYVVINSTADGLVFVDLPSDQVGPTSWIDLNDTVSFIGTPGQHVVVNSAGILSFADLASDLVGASTFLELTDTPGTYSGQAGKHVIVNSAEDGLIFVDLPSDQIGAVSWVDLNDTDSALGTQGQYVVVDSTGTFLTFTDLPSFTTSGHTGTETVVTDWTISGTDIILKRAGVDMVDGLVKSWALLSDIVIQGSTCSCPSDQVGASTFLELTDTPSAYGTAGQYVIINSTADGLIFTDLPSDQIGASTWVQLNDTVSAIGNPGQHVVVNSAGILSFADLASDLVGASTFLQLTDTPGTYGTQGQYVVINSTADGLIFTDLPSATVYSTTVDLGLIKDSSNNFGIDFDNMTTTSTLDLMDFIITNENGPEVQKTSLADVNAVFEFILQADTPSTYVGQAGQYIRVNSTPNGLEFVDPPVDRSAWVQLTDTDSALGTIGQYVIVDPTGNFLTFTDLPSGAGGAPFPSNGLTSAEDVVISWAVNASGNVVTTRRLFTYTDGLLTAIGAPVTTTISTEECSCPSDQVGASTFLELTDTPGAYGTVGQYVVINSTADGLIFIDLPTDSDLTYSTTVDLGLIKDSSNNFGIDFDNMTATSTLNLMDWVITNQGGPEVQRTGLAEVNAILRFILQEDTPSTYVGQAGKYIRVNSTPNGLEFVDAPAENSVVVDDGLRKDGNDDFGLDFDNTENTAPVLTDEVFHGTGTVVNANTLSDINAIMEFIRLTDTPAAYAGEANKLVAVNGAANALEFIDASTAVGGLIPIISGHTGNEVVVTDWTISGTDIILKRAGVDMVDGLVKSWALLSDIVIQGSTCSCPSDQVGASTFLELTDTPSVYGTQGQYVVINSTADGLVFIDLPSDQVGAVSWVDLNDTDSALGTAGQIVVVDSTGTFLTFADLASDLVGASTFLELTDTPSVYGTQGQYVTINSTADGLIFTDLPSTTPFPDSGITSAEDVVISWAVNGSGNIVTTKRLFTYTDGLLTAMGAPVTTTISTEECSCPSDQVGASTFLELTDTPGAYGTAGQYVVINSAADGLIFTDIPSAVAYSVEVDGGLKLDSANNFGFDFGNMIATPSSLNLTDGMITAAGTGSKPAFTGLAEVNQIFRFILQEDTPSTYVGQAGKYLRVNSTPNGLEFVDAPDYSVIVNDGLRKDGNDDFGMDFNNTENTAPTLTDEIFHGLGTTVNANTLADINAIMEFIRLTDTPAAYAGEAGKIVAVNGAANALEFITKSDVVNGGGGGGVVTTWVGLTDTVNTLGNLGQHVVVASDSGGKYLSFIDEPTFTTSGHTGNEVVVTDWTVSGTDIILKRAGVDMVDGLVKSWALLSDIIIAGSTCSCPVGSAGGAGLSTFLELTDTPSAYGNSGQYVIINSTADGLIFTDLPTYSTVVNGGIRIDGNNDFGMNFDNAGNVAPVLTDEVFHGTATTVNANTLADINNIMEFIRLTDTPGAYAGNANKLVTVNGAANAVEFTEAS